MKERKKLVRYKIEQKRGENDDWIGTCSGVMRETRSEGCHWGKMVSGLARIRGEGGAAELRREALLWKEERDGEQLVVVLEANASLWWWWWWLSRVTEGVLAVATVVELGFLRCGGTYDIVLALASSKRGLIEKRVSEVKW